MNVLELAQRKVKMKKVSSTKGGEWHGPCPGCGGDDRFHIWPEEMEGKGAYWCRSCGKTGDNIQFLREFSGLSFPDACAELGIALPDRPSPSLSSRFSSPKAPLPPTPEAPSFTPAVHSSPADLWQEKAEKFVAWAQEKLLWNSEAVAWLEERGIDLKTAKDFRLGWNPGEEGKDYYRARKAWGLPESLRDDGRPKALWIPIGLVIPYYVEGVLHRIRIRRPVGEPRYYVIPGSSMSIMMIGSERRAFVVVESELDAIACASACPLAGAVALGSVSAKPDADTEAALRKSLSILLALDYDAAGKKAVAWWSQQFPNCHRWPVPKGKDPGDARRMGIDLEQWIKAGLPPALTIEAKEAGINSGQQEKAQGSEHKQASGINFELRPDLPAPIRELYELLRKNPGVRIINSESRYTVMRNGKFVGGRINELVFRVPEVVDYILKNPAQLIDASNLIVEG
ncbi:MAG: DNA primase [Syntrophus sp. PtaB.Bin001]|nr:MAG: DNA primase [Syntrophus sp. PtaB.Bin001]